VFGQQLEAKVLRKKIGENFNNNPNIELLMRARSKQTFVNTLYLSSVVAIISIK